VSGTNLLVDFEDVAELFGALSSPVRVAIIARLTTGEACVHDLVEGLGLPQPLISQHLRVLRGADLVTRSRRGREVTYTLADEHVAHIVRDALSHSTEGSHDHDDGAPER
jgi:DNA-binding transcriptional ArsR family regulator